MWWNFVGGDHEEIAAARADWMAQVTDNTGTLADSAEIYDGRFGIVARPPASDPGPGPPERPPQTSPLTVELALNGARVGGGRIRGMSGVVVGDDGLARCPVGRG